jgi:hypothetical protein
LKTLKHHASDMPGPLEARAGTVTVIAKFHCDPGPGPEFRVIFESGESESCQPEPERTAHFNEAAVQLKTAAAVQLKTRPGKKEVEIITESRITGPWRRQSPRAHCHIIESAGPSQSPTGRSGRSGRGRAFHRDCDGFTRRGLRLVLRYLKLEPDLQYLSSSAREKNIQIS